MEKMTAARFAELMNRRQKSFEVYKNLRLGQYLMNNLVGAVADPQIYYLADDDFALKLFMDRYVDF